MKASALKYMILSTMATLVMVILVLIPFHAFLTVWLSTVFGHYTALRLWKEYLLVLLTLGGLYLLLADRKIRTHTLPRLLVQLIIAYALVQVVWGVIAHEHHDVSTKALAYGVLIDMRYFFFFFIAWGIALRTSRLKKYWQPLLLWPAVVVILFGLLQAFVLPNNFLSHFGYGPNTIMPFETINHNTAFVRIESTLRGSNPLGAYLLLPLCAISILLLRKKQDWRTIFLLIGGLVVLFFSFSRAAWLGAIVALGIVFITNLQSRQLKIRILYGAAAAVVVLAGLVYAFRNDTYEQNILWHTQTHSTVKSTSDAGHASALETGLRDVLHDPVGHGPGTSGPASVYNHDQPARIPEDYFLQLGEETGWLGLALFLIINVGVAYLLWLRRHDSLSLALFASFIGICIINLLTQAWTDDTLAYLWWGLAGVAMASPPVKRAEDTEPA